MTKQFGKLKLHVSKKGIAYKWADGDIRRFSFGGSKGTQDDAYAANGNGAEPDYSQGERYGQYGYATHDPNLAQGSSDYHSSQDYDDDDYGAQHDGPYYGGNQNYDAEHSGHYEGESEPYGLNGFLYHNDIVMWLALVLLPPLGIWILWKREKFDLVIRAAISALSAIWFIIILVWLFSALFNKSPDTTSANINLGSALTSTQAPADSVDQTGTNITTPNGLADNTTDNLLPANPNLGTVPIDLTGGASNTGGSGGSNTGGSGSTQPLDDPQSESGDTLVWATASGAFYHKDESCSRISGTASKITLAAARTQNKQPCPDCYTGTQSQQGGTGASSSTTYYGTSGGKYYHINTKCSGMVGARPLTAAQVKSKSACPTCIGKYYMTSSGTYYHSKSNCSGMKGAKLVTLASAKASKKKPCPVCVTKRAASSSSITYYATTGGTYYHTKASCSGMKDAQRITLAQASARKQKPCPICVSSSSTSGKTYYATSSGTYYHTKSNCSGMKGAAKITLTTAKKRGLKSCPVCVSTSSGSKVYYATESGAYYHLKSNCSGMKSAKKITLATAKAKGKKACPVCVSKSTGNTYVYTVSSNRYYHSKNNCSGMRNAQRVTLANAKSKGKTACPVCMSTVYYYSTSSNKYYHRNATCSGMKNASKMTLVSARSKGKSACPVCVTKKVNANDLKTYCYATTGGRYYHKNKTCQGMKNARKITLASAKLSGKKACPVCVKKSGSGNTSSTQSADSKVTCYLLKKGTFYHSSPSCSKLQGKKGIVKTSVATAKKNHKEACPDCVGSKLRTYVYVMPTGLLYHRTSTCSDMKNPTKLTLQTALNRAYKRCTKCNAPSA